MDTKALLAQITEIAAEHETLRADAEAWREFQALLPNDLVGATPEELSSLVDGVNDLASSRDLITAAVYQRRQPTAVASKRTDKPSTPRKIVTDEQRLLIAEHIDGPISATIELTGLADSTISRIRTQIRAQRGG
jgi:hypothetical protein